MKSEKKRWLQNLIAALILLGVWQLLSMLVGKEILLPSPGSTLSALLRLAGTGAFYKALGGSMLRVAAGFLLALPIGVVMAVSGRGNAYVGAVWNLLIRLIKSIPVASFIILVLLWVSSKNLSVVIAFLIVLPIVYENVAAGICSVNQKLLEMATVFGMKRSSVVRYIYVPAIRPHLLSACAVGLGFCWKAGIAAEVIGLPTNSIGLNLYEAKLYLMTPELFAWTIALILVSFLMEKLLIGGLKRLVDAETYK